MYKKMKEHLKSIDLTLIIINLSPHIYFQIKIQLGSMFYELDELIKGDYCLRRRNPHNATGYNASYFCDAKILRTFTSISTYQDIFFCLKRHCSPEDSNKSHGQGSSPLLFIFSKPILTIYLCSTWTAYRTRMADTNKFR